MSDKVLILAYVIHVNLQNSSNFSSLVSFVFKKKGILGWVVSKVQEDVLIKE